MNRDLIYSTLLTLLSKTTGIKIDSRRVRLINDVSPTDKPSLFLFETGNTYQTNHGMPPKITLSATVLIYTNIGRDPKVIPATIMNNLLDAVDSAIYPNDLVDYVQTLGGLVCRCWIEGDVQIDSGDLDGEGIAQIPFKILTNH